LTQAKVIIDAVGPHRRVKRNAMMRRSVRWSVRDGETCGRDEESVSLPCA